MLLELLVLAATLVGIIAAYLLYKAAHIRKEVILSDPNAAVKTHAAATAPAVRDRVREKVRSLPLAGPDTEQTVQQISHFVEEQAQNLVKEIRQEYSVKYQVAVQEKDREVEQIKKKYQDVEDKFKNVEQAYKKVDDEKRTTEAVVRSIAEGLVVVNQKGEVLLMNPSAEKLLGVEKTKKIGKPLTDNLPGELLVSLSRESRDTGEKMIEFKSKDENVKKILRSSSAVIQNENGQTVGMVNILTDVTKQRELDEVKKKFLSNITHEFRTPIVAMQKAMAVLMSAQAGDLSDTQRNFLNIVSRNLVHLSRLVEDLLDMARIDSGKLIIRPVASRLDRLVFEVCDALETWAKSKNQQLAREIDRSIPEIQLDPDKITQVLNNLIGNAIKFTPMGGRITVSATWDAKRGEAAVSVADTGVGIAAQDMPKLFKRFEQFGDQQGISGTGLGLSISKEIVEKHGGQIDARSEEKKGSTFTFTIPLKRARTREA